MSAVQVYADLLLATHETLDLNWTLTIIGSTIAFRSLVTLPFAILQRKNSELVKKIEPLLNGWKNTLRKQVSNDKQVLHKDLEYNRKVGIRMRDIYSGFKCHPRNSIILPFFQIPFFIIATGGVRIVLGSPFLLIGRSEPYGGMISEGMLWFEDLTLPDPTFIGPLILGLMHLINAEIGGYLRLNLAPSTQKLMSSLFFVVYLVLFKAGSALMMIIAIKAPMVTNLKFKT